MICGRALVNELEVIARAVLGGDALVVRSKVQDWLASSPRFDKCDPPDCADPSILAVAASLVELLASRRGQSAPGWTKSVGAVDRPLYLLKSAESMPRLRQLCDEESPEPLRKRRLFAPPNYLEFV